MKTGPFAAVLLGSLAVSCARGNVTPPSTAMPVPVSLQTHEPPSPSAIAPPLAIAPATDDRPLVAVTRADWCPACRRIEPVVKRVEEEFRGRATFVYLDLTDDDTEAQARERAAQMHIEDFYAVNGGRTGVVAVFGRDRRFPVRVRSLEPEPYRQAIEEAVRSYDGGRKASR